MIGGFRFVLGVSVFQGSLLVVVIMTDSSEIVKAAFEMQNSCVFEKHSKVTFLNCTLFFMLC